MSAQLVAAVRKRLAAYLQAELAAAFPTLKALGEWPAPNQPLAPYTVAVLSAGAPDEEGHPPEIHRVTPGASPNGTVVYSYGTAELPLQLDAWATSPAARDALAAALGDALNRHPADTLGLGGLPRLRRRSGLVLKVPDLLDAPCDFAFAAAPAVPESSAAAHAHEWRATWAGTASVHLVTAEQVALVKRITLTLTTNGAAETRTVEP